MAYPCLIPDWALNATATVQIAGEGVNEDGEMVPELEITKLCNIQLKNTQKLDSKKHTFKVIFAQTYEQLKADHLPAMM